MEAARVHLLGSIGRPGAIVQHCTRHSKQYFWWTDKFWIGAKKADLERCSCDHAGSIPGNVQERMLPLVAATVSHRSELDRKRDAHLDTKTDHFQRRLHYGCVFHLSSL